ncbi:MAG: hypothetical protein NTX42_05645, partial [Methanothrix sp.]|nr:hypothetical protein [Methanothrix sp.]
MNVAGKPKYGENVTNSTTETVTTEKANIEVTKTALPKTGSLGTLVNFTLNVTNTGVADLPHVFVSDLLPTGLTFDSSSTGGSNVGQTVSWSDI